MAIELLIDTCSSPYQLHDGSEPSVLAFHPSKLSIEGFSEFDLLSSSTLDELTDTEKQRVYALAPLIVSATSPSSGNSLSLRSDYSISEENTEGNRLIVQYSFFEVSNMRYTSFLHRVLTIESTKS